LATKSWRTVSSLRTLRIVGPVSDLQEGAQRIGAGDWSHRIKVSSVPRLSEVARSINGMAECIEEQMRNVRRLETVRQDFVANVSHELKTPVTSIRGFAETLLDGALHTPETAERFVKIIYRQSCQLESILKDLMELVRLEHDTGKKLDAPRIPLLPVLNSAVELCRERAAEHKADIHVSCAEDIAVEAHPGFLEQALVNLISNAITYGVSPVCARVDVDAVRDNGGVTIKVRDYGAGIEKAHLERLFERFYRVDKGRSRNVGGTGLGLAIVKHIAAIHGGTVSVKSKIGHGTVFSLHLHESIRNPSPDSDLP
jgi:two-component system phosphate regulon sensor histidine kinase PhoR